jgi:hypothetical protein
MIRAIFTALVFLALAPGVASSQAPNASGPPALLKAEEIIRLLPGRWEYRAEDGWETGGNVSTRKSCDGHAERIWFERDKQGVVYYAEDEGVDSPTRRSRVAFDRILIFERPVIRIQYEGETRLDENGKPVAWEVYMTDPDTFYWHRVGWPNGATTAAVRRCKEAVIS